MNSYASGQVIKPLYCIFLSVDDRINSVLPPLRIVMLQKVEKYFETNF